MGIYMKNTIGLIGKSLAERFFSVLLTCAVTALALYLFDEAWTEYRYQIRISQSLPEKDLL